MHGGSHLLGVSIAHEGPSEAKQQGLPGMFNLPPSLLAWRVRNYSMDLRLTTKLKTKACNHSISQTVRSIKYAFVCLCMPYAFVCYVALSRWCQAKDESLSEADQGGSRGPPPQERSIYRPPCSRGECSGAFWTGPMDLLVGRRTSWGILPQAPVFSLRSASCRR
jgi:hypothetical protein